MGSHLDVSRPQDCGLDTIAPVSGRQLGGSLALQVARQLPALSLQAIQDSTSPVVPRACPVASRRSSNCSGCEALPQQGDCGMQCFFSALQEALGGGGSSSHSSGRLAAGRPPWCAVSLLGEGRLSWPRHSLL